VLGFEQQEGRRRRRHTWWLLVAGEWPDQDLGAAAAAAAAVARSSPRGRERARGVNGREKRRVKGAVWLRPCLVPHLKIFHPSHRIFGHMYGTLNVNKK